MFEKKLKFVGSFQWLRYSFIQCYRRIRKSNYFPLIFILLMSTAKATNVKATHETEFRFYLYFSDWFCIKQNLVGCQIMYWSCGIHCWLYTLLLISHSEAICFNAIFGSFRLYWGQSTARAFSSKVKVNNKIAISLWPFNQWNVNYYPNRCFKNTCYVGYLFFYIARDALKLLYLYQQYYYK